MARGCLSTRYRQHLALGNLARGEEHTGSMHANIEQYPAWLQFKGGTQLGPGFKLKVGGQHKNRAKARLSDCSRMARTEADVA